MIITTRWWLWSIGIGFSRGSLITYACGQTEGELTEFYLIIGPFEFFCPSRLWMKRKKSNKRYSDDFIF